jgi:protein-tyrosine phosphatase
MIDTHCHLLPNVDDGPKDWETALRMVSLAQADGIRQVITTPHWTGVPEETERVRRRFAEFQSRCEGLEVFLGQELVLMPQLLTSLQEGSALTLAGSAYLLLETAQLEFGAFKHQALFQLQSHGYRIILAHPERVPGWQREPSELRKLLERGCYAQVNAGSLTGSFGRSAQRAAESFVRRGWVSLVASDAHSDSGRPPLLSAAVERCEALVGERATELLVTDNPARVLCNELLPYPNLDEPERERAGRRWFWPWGRGRN